MRLLPGLCPLLALALVLPLPASSQTRDGVLGDLMKDVTDVQKKITGLASAMPEKTYDWRPSQGARSTAETLKHVIADNYFLPALMGATPPADTGIDAKDYKTTLAYEKRTLTRDQILGELEKSFEFLRTSMAAMPDEKLGAPLDLFGQKRTNRSLWISTTTHLHEHLGQLIAYARSNNVTPPWSK